MNRRCKSSLLCIAVLVVFLSSTEAQVRKGMQIFGGRAVSLSQFGYQLQYVIRRQTVCGACLIANTWAITAAHCTDVQKTGITLLGASTARESGISITVLKLFQHQDYSPVTFQHDISLLFFAPITFSNAMFPIKLPSKTQQFPTGTKCQISGFGLTEDGSQAKILLGTEVTIADQESCAKNYSLASFPITKNMVCAGWVDGKQDSCSGDSVS